MALSIGCVLACDAEDEGEQADEQTVSRCRVLCDEDDCGAETSECVDACEVQSRGLDALCVQCLVENSYLDLSRRIDDQSICEWDPQYGWFVCDEGSRQCGLDDTGMCDDAASTCELDFGDLDDCSDFCR